MRHTALLVKLYFSGRRVVGSSGRRGFSSSYLLCMGMGMGMGLGVRVWDRVIER